MRPWQQVMYARGENECGQRPSYHPLRFQVGWQVQRMRGPIAINTVSTYKCVAKLNDGEGHRATVPRLTAVSIVVAVLAALVRTVGRQVLVVRGVGGASNRGGRHSGNSGQGQR